MYYNMEDDTDYGLRWVFSNKSVTSNKTANGNLKELGFIQALAQEPKIYAEGYLFKWVYDPGLRDFQVKLRYLWNESSSGLLVNILPTFLL